MTTTARLLNLLSLLQMRQEWPGSALASRLDVSDRTVRRDIERLREMGYRIRATMGPDGGYRLEAGSELPPLLFDDDQTVAVALALQAAPAIGADIAEAAVRALATIRQVVPARLRHRLDALEVTAVGRAGDTVPVDVSPDVLVTLADAIRDREVLRFDYVPRDAGAAAPAGPARRRRFGPPRCPPAPPPPPRPGSPPGPRGRTPGPPAPGRGPAAFSASWEASRRGWQPNWPRRGRRRLRGQLGGGPACRVRIA
ncbi:helix-turn-helix transcriptional regulator, partial [Streptomyces galbus]